MSWSPVLGRAAVLWIPLAAALTGLTVLVYAAVLTDLRGGADDPQIQLVEDTTARLDAGDAPSAVAPAGTVDLATSLDPFVIVYDRARNVLASSATLHGRQPDVPRGVLDAAAGGQQVVVTWQPEPGIRSAVVAQRWSGGTVLAGRSLRLVETHEAQLRFVIAVSWVGVLAVTALGAVMAGVIDPLDRRRSPPRGGDGGDGGGDEPPPPPASPGRSVWRPSPGRGRPGRRRSVRPPRVSG